MTPMSEEEIEEAYQYLLSHGVEISTPATLRLASLMNEIRRLQSQLAEQRKEIEAATQKECGRWADRLDFVHREYGVDGSGTESGDELDVIQSEIRQALNNLTYQNKKAKKEIEELRKQVEGKWIKTSERLPEVGDFTAIRIIRPGGQDEYLVREFLPNVGWWFDKSVSIAEWTLLPRKILQDKL